MNEFGRPLEELEACCDEARAEPLNSLVSGWVSFYDSTLKLIGSHKRGPAAADDAQVRAACASPEARQARQAVLKEGERQERALSLPDGGCVRIVAEALVDGKGAVSGVAEYLEFLKVDGRIAREALSRGELRQRLLDGFGDAVFIQDREGFFIDVNEAALRMYGMKSEDLIGAHPRDFAEAQHFSEATFKEILSRVFEGEHQQLVFWGRRADGTSFPQEVKIGPGIRYGAPVAVASARDISHRIRAEQALIESENRFRTLLQEVPTLAVYGFGSDGKIRYWNRASEALYGFSAEEAVGQSVLDLIVPPVDQADAADRLTRILETSKAAEPRETVYMRKNGSRLPVMCTCLLVQLPGRDPEIYHLDLDLTERKQAESALIYAKEVAESSNQAKGTFLATMSHEIRTPLYAVIGMSSQLAQSELTETQREMAQTIVTSGEALLSLISGILDYSKFEAGKFDIERKPFSLSHAITEPLEIIASQAAAKGIELSYRVDAQTPAVLIGDNNRLRQVLLNLLSNAIKFTDAGEISLSVEAVHQEGDTWLIHFSITDTGIGIPEETQQSLFEPFVQGHSGNVRQFGGSGLGLAISRKLVDAMGGIITLHSREDEGTTFQFFIRAEADAASGRIYSVEASESLDGRFALIIDGNSNNRLMFTSAIQSWGLRAQALAAISELEANEGLLQKADVVVCGFRAGLADGLDPVELRRKAGRPDLPILLLNSMPMDPQECARLGYSGSLVVPIRPPILHRSIVGAIGGETSPSVSALRKTEDIPVTRQLNVLIVEDDKVSQRVTRMIVHKLGHHTHVVENGQEALEALTCAHYDLILLDRRMPVMDGITTACEIMRLYPDPIRRPKIIALTADAMAEDRERFFAAGVDAYLAKPLRPDDLHRTTTRLVGG